MKKNVTIYDVAAHSGVSVASVSRVLARSKYPVSEETRQKVLRSAEKLNYTVNAMGKMLKNQSTREIGIMLCHACAGNAGGGHSKRLSRIAV